MLAYGFSLRRLFWSMLMLWVLVLAAFAAIWSFIDSFRRSDHSGWAKAAWAFLILAVPIAGSIVCIVARPIRFD
jgi:magnesium-transporting ATPase (P-type)